MDRLKVKIINNSGNALPSYETPSAAGMDVRAFPTEPIIMQPMQRVLVPTGLRVQLPQGYEMQIRPRSGMALKHGITLANSPGTVDADYRGDIGIIVINLSDKPFVINDGDRICQMVIKQYSHVEWELVDRINETVRGDGAFGHTGIE